MDLIFSKYDDSTVDEMFHKLCVSVMYVNYKSVHICLESMVIEIFPLFEIKLYIYIYESKRGGKKKKKIKICIKYKTCVTLIYIYYLILPFKLSSKSFLFLTFFGVFQISWNILFFCFKTETMNLSYFSQLNKQKNIQYCEIWNIKI